MSRVEILLSTFNGSRFIDEQLDSYVRQTHGGWELLVRDDGSSDDTVKRIDRHAAKHGYPYRWAPDSGAHLGYPATFFSLLEASSAPVVLFSDQDDVWFPDKVAVFLDAFRQLPNDAPALVHSDLAVVDARLACIHRSFLEYMRMHPPRSSSLLGLLCWEYVTGCAAGVNARARELFRSPPASVHVGHDAWLALICAALGTVRFLDRPTTYYRQHGSNAIGVNFRRVKARSWWELTLKERRERNAIPLARARALLEYYGPLLDGRRRRELSAFANLDNASPLSLVDLGFEGALPADPTARRRLLAVFAKMQVKARLLAVEERLARLAGRPRLGGSS